MNSNNSVDFLMGLFSQFINGEESVKAAASSPADSSLPAKANKASKGTIQLPVNLYIYEVFSKPEARWVTHTVLTYNQDLADMHTWKTHRSQYRLRKIVYGGDRRGGMKKQRAVSARLVHTVQKLS